MPNKKPVFLIVIPSFTLGGTERQGLAFAMALRHKGNFEPVLLGLGRQGELVGVLQKAGLKYCHFDGNDFMNGNSRKRALTIPQQRQPLVSQPLKHPLLYQTVQMRSHHGRFRPIVDALYHGDWFMKFVAGRDLYGAHIKTDIGTLTVLLF
jgi:hypothetical protein